MPNKPYEVGITGGIGSGKSTVSRIFRVLGVSVYDADRRARWLMENNEKLGTDLRAMFGESVFIDDGINRDLIAQKVFDQPELLSQLNSAVHPVVGQDYTAWVKKHRGDKYVLKEAALLIESGSYKQLDSLIHVWSPIELRIERIKHRDPFRSSQEIRKIINNQLSDEERDAKSDHKMINDESQSLIEQVLALHKEFS